MAEKLLLVDDDAFIRSITQEVLEKVGYSVETADDGLEAWEKISANHAGYELMLLDKHMPRMDGIALLQRMKADARFREFPVIMLTGDTSPQDVVDGLDAGAYYYLTKPSTEQVLKQVIRNALNDFAQKRELRSQVGQQAKSLPLLRRAEFCFQTLQQARDLALWLADASMNPAIPSC